MTLGDTFYFNHPSAHRHLWVVAGGPNAEGEFAIFNLTSVQPGCDATCVLNLGDHPMIEHATYVTYLRGRLLPGNLEQTQGHYIAWQPPVSAAVLQRIQHGALASPYTSGKLRKVVEASLKPMGNQPGP